MTSTITERKVRRDIHIQSSTGVQCQVNGGVWKAMVGAHSGSMRTRYPKWEDGKCFVMARWKLAINFRSILSTKPTGVQLRAWDNLTKEANAKVHDGYLQHDDRRGIIEPGPRDMPSIDVTDFFFPFWHGDEVGSFQNGPYFKDNGSTGPRIHVSVVEHYFERTTVYSDDGRLLRVIEGRPDSAAAKAYHRRLARQRTTRRTTKRKRK